MTDKTPIDKAAEDLLSAIANGTISLKDNEGAAEIFRRSLKEYSNDSVIEDIHEGKCTCPVGD